MQRKNNLKNVLSKRSIKNYKLSFHLRSDYNNCAGGKFKNV